MSIKYINADAFRKQLIDRQITTQFFNPREREEIGCIVEMLDKAPAANIAEVVHGHWENEPPYQAPAGYFKSQTCSVCGATFVSNGNEPYSNHPYCCKCGAKMDEPPTVWRGIL